LAVSADRAPADCWLEHLLAKLGLLDDAAPLFRDGGHVPRAGVLLALPAIAAGSCTPRVRSTARSGRRSTALRTTIVALAFLALLRPESDVVELHAGAIAVREVGRALGPADARCSRRWARRTTPPRSPRGARPGRCEEIVGALTLAELARRAPTSAWCSASSAFF